MKKLGGWETAKQPAGADMKELFLIASQKEEKRERKIAWGGERGN